MDVENNHLIPFILQYLQRSPHQCTLLDLVACCDEQLQRVISKDDPLMGAFETNFFVMNGLYQLQRQLWAEHGLQLAISPMAIRILPGAANADTQALARDSSLANYYLDWSNLRQTSDRDVNDLLASFWQRMASTDKLDWAIEVLEVTQPLKKSVVVSAYRAKASLTHPDKGGDAQMFLCVREAYEILLALCPPEYDA